MLVFTGGQEWILVSNDLLRWIFFFLIAIFKKMVSNENCFLLVVVGQCFGGQHGHSVAFYW